MLKKLRLSRAAPLLAGRRVLLRADFNVPLRDGAVADATRIAATLPTLEAVLRQRPAALVLASHLGRPGGRPLPEASLRPVAAELARLLGRPVRFVDDCAGAEAAGLAGLRGGELVLLENLRFHAEEEGKGVDERGSKTRVGPERVRAFPERLSALGEVFVNDAFGAVHRAHASISGVRLPVRMAGLLLERELEFLGRVLEAPRRPVVIALGGAKVADKLPLVRNLLRLADEVLLGGALSFAFLRAEGAALGDSAGAADDAEVAAVVAEARERGVRLLLPSDLVVAPSVEAAGKARVVSVAEGVPAGWRALDVGPATVERFRAVILAARTLVLNGPMGAFETAEFARGSVGVVEAMCEATRRGALSVVGGGDYARLVNAVPGAVETISHVSTGGGATLELLEGKKLPGIEALSDESEFLTQA